MKKSLSYIFLFSVLLLLASCKKDNEKEQKAISRAVLFYVVSENSLDGACRGDINEVINAKSFIADDEEIVLYVDDRTTPAIYTINNKTTASSFTDLVAEYSYEEDHNSCSIDALTDFLDYVKKYHPAESYGIVFESHGSGWIPSNYDGDSKNFVNRRKAFGIDNGKNSSSNYGNKMCISDLHKSLQAFGRTFEYIMFDACFMQCVEVDYELRDVAKYIIASPAEIPVAGADYYDLLPALFSKSDYAKAIPSAYYEAYKNNVSFGVLISAVDCSKLETLASMTRNMILGHKDELFNMSYSGLLNYYNYRVGGEQPDFYDMNAIFKRLLSDTEYNAWKQSFDEAVPYSYATDFWVSEFTYPSHVTLDHDQYGGVSMFVPLDKYSNNYLASLSKFFVDGYYSSEWGKKMFDNISTE